MGQSSGLSQRVYHCGTCASNGRLLGPSYYCAKRVFLPDIARDIFQTGSFRCYCTVCAPCRTDRRGRAGIGVEPCTSFVSGIPAIRPWHWLQPIGRDGWTSCEQCRHGFWRRDDLCDDTRRPNQGKWGITRAPSLARWALSDEWAIVSADRHVDVWLLLGRSRCDRHSVLRSFRDEEHNCLGGMTIFAYKIVSRKV